MPRPLAILNVLLLLVAAGAVAYIVREVTAPPRPMPLRPRATVAETSPATPGTAPAPLPGGYDVVASKNLFSPTRSEGPAPGTPTGRPAGALPKPTLHGVVLRDGAPIAYLEDPGTKRVAGYRLGDSIAGGTVKAITADHVVLTRPEGTVDVRLRDPAKPRPAAAPPPGAPGSAPSGQPGTPGRLPTPGATFPPGVPGTIPGAPGFPRAPGATVNPFNPGQHFPLPPRRLMPPNVLRRVPPTQSDATQ